MLCRDLTLVKQENDLTRCSPLYCRSWTCDICAPKRQAELIHTAQEGKPDALITLTVSPAVGSSPNDRAAMLADAWRAFRRKHSAQNPSDPVPFIAIFEATEAGEPHLHILARVKWIPQAGLSRFMATRIGAPVVDIRRVGSRRGVAKYVAKYLGKDPIRFGTCKRYWHTPGWSRWRAHYREELRAQGVRFRIERTPLEDYRRDAEAIGYFCEPDRDGYILRWWPAGQAPPHQRSPFDAPPETWWK